MSTRPEARFSRMNDDDKTAETPKAPDYAKLEADQQKQLDSLLEQRKSGPSPQLELAIVRKKDTVRHIRNLAAGNPKERARSAALTARQVVLDLVIVSDSE